MDMQALQAAEAIAEQAHGDQKYGELPYIKHLGDVVAVLMRFGVKDQDMLCAGWLHDSLEDTKLSPLVIEATFGRRTLDLVQRVTNEPGVNRKERHAKTYPKIIASDDALTLKLADRIANIEFGVATKADILKMYKKEYKGFRKALHKDGKHDAMWRHLDFLLGFEQ